MKKISTAVTIYLPRNNHAKCPIYEHEGRFYIKANKPNTLSYSPFRFNDELYFEVYSIDGQWFTK